MNDAQKTEAQRITTVITTALLACSTGKLTKETISTTRVIATRAFQNYVTKQLLNRTLQISEPVAQGVPDRVHATLLLRHLPVIRLPAIPVVVGHPCFNRTPAKQDNTGQTKASQNKSRRISIRHAR